MKKKIWHVAIHAQLCLGLLLSLFLFPYSIILIAGEKNFNAFPI